MISFYSMCASMIAIMLAGKYFPGKRGAMAIIVMTALLQTGIFIYEFWTMEIPQP